MEGERLLHAATMCILVLSMGFATVASIYVAAGARKNAMKPTGPGLLAAAFGLMTLNGAVWAALEFIEPDMDVFQVVGVCTTVLEGIATLLLLAGLAMLGGAGGRTSASVREAP